VEKRTFEERNGYLVDRYKGDDGGPVEAHLPLTSFEPANEDCREAAIAALRSGAGPYCGTLIDDGDDGSREYCDALLQALDNGAVFGVPHALLRHLRDERVPAALVEALKHADGGRLSNLAQVVGIAGGPGVLNALRDWNERLAGDEATFLDAKFCNRFASDLATICEAQLRLNPDEFAAAVALRRLFEHPVGLNRRTAVRGAAEVCGGDLKTAPILHLRKGLEQLVDGTDNVLFLAALPGLAGAPRSVVIQRVEALALCDDPGTVRQAATALCSCTFLRRERTRILSECLATDPSPRIALYLAGWLAGGLEWDQVSERVQRALADESPSLRNDAIGLLTRMPSGQAVGLAREAISDEPDPRLRTRLAVFLGTD
jgi:hypothetical protein